jgi:hypothetical protein
MLIVFICHRCVDQIKRKSTCPCKERKGLEWEGVRSMVTMALASLHYVVVVCGALWFGGCAQVEDQMGAEPMPF